MCFDRRVPTSWTNHQPISSWSYTVSPLGNGFASVCLLFVVGDFPSGHDVPLLNLVHCLLVVTKFTSITAIFAIEFQHTAVCIAVYLWITLNLSPCESDR
jgi:hypothetical protein